MKRWILWAAVLVGAVLGFTVGTRSWSMRDPVEDAPAPEFSAGLEWLQGGPLKLADLQGRVVVVHFWTNGCLNCIHNYPVYRAWQEKYDAKKVSIIGVHTPEFAREAAPDLIKKKAAANSLKFPIVLDPESKVWKAWGTQYWPSIYLVDKKGGVRYRWEGELHLDTPDGKQFAARIDELLDEKP
jgi:thiol-disulfide isomerase/thioredoxin